jgi:hypothetical protein
MGRAGERFKAAHSRGRYTTAASFDMAISYYCQKISDISVVSATGPSGRNATEV